jgi:two-component system sensor histidine kinase/response regulator
MGTAHQSGAKTVMGNTRSILVVDDERIVLNSCRAILSERGYQLETVPSGEEALRLIEERSFDVALIDLKMPGMPGNELLSKIQEMRPETVNVIITGFATVETAIDAMKRGAFDYVCKPFTPAELEVVVEKAVERRMLEQAAEEAEREKERFILTIYHHLKSPVGIIQGYVKNLLNGVPAEESERMAVLHRCLKRAETLRQLLEDLLSLNRLQSGKVEPKMEPVNLQEVLCEAAEGYKIRAQEKNVRLEANVGGDLPSVKGNKEQLTHLFGNLIDNALRYNREGGAVELRAVPNNSEVRVEVSDTGLGISKEELPQIFDEYYRCQNEQSRAIPGTGLGLPIVKAIVEAHAGRIDIESDLGKGTTFSVWLPRWE